MCVFYSCVLSWRIQHSLGFMWHPLLFILSSGRLEWWELVCTWLRMTSLKKDRSSR